MSALADFVRLPTSAVDQLRWNYQGTLTQGTIAAEYLASGYVFVTLLAYLEEHGISFDQDPYDTLAPELCQQEELLFFMLLTPAHRTAGLD